MCRSWVSVISSMRWCTSSISARSLFNSLNIVSQKTSRSNTSISSLRCVHVNWRRRKIYKRRGEKHRQMGYLLIGGLISTKGNWINISTVRPGPFLEKRNNLNPSGPRLTNRENVLSFHFSIDLTSAQMRCQFYERRMGCLSGLILTLEHLFCAVLCACWIGGRIGVDGSWIGGKKAIGYRPLGQSLKAAKCHEFTVTGITRGNQDYRGREISCVLANRNLDLPGRISNHSCVVVLESANCDLLFISLKHIETVDELSAAVWTGIWEIYYQHCVSHSRCVFNNNFFLTLWKHLFCSSTDILAALLQRMCVQKSIS